MLRTKTSITALDVMVYTRAVYDITCAETFAHRIPEWEKTV